MTKTKSKKAHTELSEITHETLTDDHLHIIFNQLNTVLSDMGYHSLQLSQLGVISKLDILAGCRQVQVCNNIPGPNGTTIRQCYMTIDCS